MSFVTFEFLVLLISTLALYYWLPQRGRMLLLLGASYLFYSYWNPWYALLILASTIIDYTAALYISGSSVKYLRKRALVISISANLGILAYFKYTNFALDSLRALLGPLGSNLPGPVELILPVGISFYTFQTMSYTIDVYLREKEVERDFLVVALFVAFFPQLVAGPIERASNLMTQLKEKQVFSFANLESGSRLILWGFLKKVAIADRLSQAAFPAHLAPNLFDTAELTFSALAMTAVVYLDFSAYSEIARGTARLFGIELSVNFRFPNVAGNIAEFWRRWHISMSTWVRDYLFNPLGGFHPRNLKAHAKTTLLTMGIVGLWHGSAWTYVLWGLGHGGALISYHIYYLHFARKFRKSYFVNSLFWRFSSWCGTLLIRTILSIFFFAPDLGKAFYFFERILFRPVEGFSKPGTLVGFALLIGFWTFHYFHYKFPLKERVDAFPPLIRAIGYCLVFYLALFGAVDSLDRFIYFQF